MSSDLNLNHLRSVAQCLPPGTTLPVPREVLLELLDAPLKPPEVDDRLLTVDEAAEQLRVKPEWLYRHSRELPFTRKLSRRQLRFSERGLRRWVGKAP